MNLGKWLALLESLCSTCPEDKPSQSSGGNRLKTCWGHKISSSSPTHDMMTITFFTFIFLLSLKFMTFLWEFFSENTYNYTYYSRTVLPYTVSLFKPLRGFNLSTNGQRNPGGGDSHMKQTGMLIVSLRGVKFRFWSHLGCSRQSANILSRQGLV